MMDRCERLRSRRDVLRKHRSTSHIKGIASDQEAGQFLNTEVNPSFLQKANVMQAYSGQIDSFGFSASEKDVDALIVDLGNDVTAGSIIEPVFLSLLDGTARAFKLGTKQGLTASRLYSECKRFNYQETRLNTVIDSFTESQNEQSNVESFGEGSSYNKGQFIREGYDDINLRDNTKMKKAKGRHMSDSMTAKDGYNSRETIFSNQAHAKSKGQKSQSAEVDHTVSCAEIANQLKSNKALNPDDIKDIVNIDDNYTLTSQKNNRGTGVGKFDKSEQQLQKEVNQGFVVKKKGTKFRKVTLSEEEIKTRRNMISKMKEAKKSIDKETNKKVTKNLIHDKITQKRLGSDALDAASSQLVGDLILTSLKPLYFELNDCLKNGIEAGVHADNLSSSLKIRFKRIKDYLMMQATSLLKDNSLNFFKNFLSMLLEGIVQCFVGVFRNVARIMKEGVKSLFQIAPILKGKNASPAEKGDAILKLIAASTTTFAGIGIETWLNSLGLGEPWSIIVASVMSAVVTVLVTYILDKLDLFGVNRELRSKRISEALEINIADSKHELIGCLQALS